MVEDRFYIRKRTSLKTTTEVPETEGNTIITLGVPVILEFTLFE